VPRPHIDYLQSQALPWQPSPWRYLPGCQVKSLSRDSDSGAVSVLVRFPSGWSAPAPGPLGTTEELIVLDGLLELGGRRYRQDCYGWFPSGWWHTVRAATDGAVALVFFGAEPVCGAGALAPAGAALEAVFMDAFERPWATDADGVDFGGAGQRRKVLRGSPARGGATMLIAAPPHRHPPSWRGPQEIHACAEEMYVLSGDFLTPAGPMTSGAYCSRPRDTAHGPYGSRGGGLALVRTHGAPLVTDYTAHELELERMPAYQPALPDGMRALGARPWRPQRY
jgi:Domain of unknown function (DUF4437)